MSATPITPPAAEEVHIEVDDDTKATIKEILSQMVNPVTAEFFLGAACKERDTNWCVPTQELLDLLVELAPPGKLIVNKHSYEDDKASFEKFGLTSNRVPAIVLDGGSIKYIGAPLGEEVRAFIETITRLSTGKTGLRQKTKETLGKLNGAAKKVEIITVVTPSCPYCPYAVLLANMFAHDSGGSVVALNVEAYEAPDIADAYSVSAVPTVAIRAADQEIGNVEFVGVPPEAELLKKVLEYGTGQSSEQETNE